MEPYSVEAGEDPEERGACQLVIRRQAASILIGVCSGLIDE